MPKPKPGCTLADLSADEKQKVSKLVQQLLRLGQEHEQLNSGYQSLAQQHAQLQRELAEEVAKKTEDTEHWRDKYTRSLQLLREYQSCILQTVQNAQSDAWNAEQTYQSQVQGYKVEIARLQGLVESQTVAMAALKTRVAQFSSIEQRQQQSEAAHRDAVRISSNEQQSLRFQLQETEHRLQTIQEELKMENRKRAQAEAMAARLQQECETCRLMMSATNSMIHAPTHPTTTTVAPPSSEVVAPAPTSAFQAVTTTATTATTTTNDSSVEVQVSPSLSTQPPLLVHTSSTLPNNPAPDMTQLPVATSSSNPLPASDIHQSTVQSYPVAAPSHTQSPPALTQVTNATIPSTLRAFLPSGIREEDIQQEIEALREQLFHLQTSRNDAPVDNSEMLQASYESQTSVRQTNSSLVQDEQTTARKQVAAQPRVNAVARRANPKKKAQELQRPKYMPHFETSHSTINSSRSVAPDSLLVDTVSALVDPGYYEDSLFSLVESLDMDNV